MSLCGKKKKIYYLLLSEITKVIMSTYLESMYLEISGKTIEKDIEVLELFTTSLIHLLVMNLWEDKQIPELIKV